MTFEQVHQALNPDMSFDELMAVTNSISVERRATRRCSRRPSSIRPWIVIRRNVR